MSQRRVQITILCEDRQQEVFARYFLKKRGFAGLFRAKICPPGSQSGEQFMSCLVRLRRSGERSGRTSRRFLIHS